MVNSKSVEVKLPLCLSTYRERGSNAPRIPDIGIRWRNEQSVSCCMYISVWKIAIITHLLEIWWAPKPEQTRWRREKS